jgi:hypothetical protein
MSSWHVVRRPVSFVVCRRCGYMPLGFGWSESDAIERAIELGWRDGLCPDCFMNECITVERLKRAERLVQSLTWSLVDQSRDSDSWELE